jgi:integrase
VKPANWISFPTTYHEETFMANPKEEVLSSSLVNDLAPDASRVVDAVSDARQLGARYCPTHPATEIAQETARTYRSHWKRFVTWCESNGVCALPVESAGLLEFIKSRCDPSAVGGSIRKSTAYLILSAIRHHQLKVQPCGFLDVEILAYLQSIDDPPVHLPVARLRDLESFLARTPSTLLHVRLKCALTLIYQELLSVPELSALMVEHCDLGEGAGSSELYYRSKYSRQFGWHPLSDRSATAIRAWMVAAQIKSGALFRPLDPRGAAAIHRAMTPLTLRQTLINAQFGWRGPPITVCSLHRGRTLDAYHPNAEPERRFEQQCRMGGGGQYRWKDAPPPRIPL